MWFSLAQGSGPSNHLHLLSSALKDTEELNHTTLNTFLRPILTVTSVWNTGESGDIYTPTKYYNIKARIIFCIYKRLIAILK